MRPSRFPPIDHSEYEQQPERPAPIPMTKRYTVQQQPRLRRSRQSQCQTERNRWIARSGEEENPDSGTGEQLPSPSKNYSGLSGIKVYDVCLVIYLLPGTIYCRVGSICSGSGPGGEIR